MFTLSTLRPEDLFKSSRACPKTLGQLFERAGIALPDAFDRDAPVAGIEDDSRAVERDFVFVAVKGVAVDGHQFIGQALEKGARLVVAERVPEGVDPARILAIESTHSALGRLAQAYWGAPSRLMQIVGITGTNGKTTTAYLIEAALRNLRRYPALFSTVEYRLGGEKREAPNTTPGAMNLARLMALAHERDADSVVMEVSSHALVQGRVEGVDFDVAVLTNVTQDHLDYHGTMEEYAEAKRLLFTRYRPRVAVFNLDDAISRRFAEEHDGQAITYSLDPYGDADLSPALLEVGPKGIQMTVRFRRGASLVEQKLYSPLRGRYNASNLLAAAAACLALGLKPEQVTAALNGMPGAPGRLEAIEAGQPFAVYVDYAHTPDAVERLLENVHDLTSGRVIAVLGCGGDRDPGKRPKMGAALGRLSDYCILTSDNPRSESPQQIVDAMEKGLVGEATGSVYEVCLDRREAIRLAIEKACPGDVVVIAGKGHETYQEIMGERHRFDDREIAREFCRERMRNQSRER